MQLDMVDLGRRGEMVLRLLASGHDCVVFDPWNPEAVPPWSLREYTVRRSMILCLSLNLRIS